MSFNGGMLTGKEIVNQINKGHISITPFKKENVNPNSYNLTLSNTLLIYDDNILDFKKKGKTSKIIIPKDGFILMPNTLYIGSTNEECWSDTFIPCINGRSSTARLGINVHITAGFGDIGWKGTWTLEITAIKPVRIYPDIEVCQAFYYTPFGDVDIKYDGRYQNQTDPTASKSYENKKVYEV